MRTRLLQLPEVREAAVATALFAAALCADLAGAGLLSWVLYAACYGVGGWRSGWEGLAALREGRLEVDLLMVLAALGASALGQPRDGGLLIVIFAVSGAQEAAMHRRTEAGVRDLLELAPDTAVRLGVDGEQVVAAAELVAGDLVLVRPGERVTADGTVTTGRSEVDQASVTGEPVPVDVAEGDPVFAGTVNGTGLLTVRVTRPAGDWVLARIARSVAQARADTAPTQQLIERVEQRYSVGMVAVTLALVVGPLLLGDEPAREVLLRAMTFMVVASPCAIVLSTMPPLLAAVAVAGRHGVLVRGASVVERLAAVRAVALDKTGTLTEGCPDLIQIDADDPDTLLALAAAVEIGSEHPVGRAVLAAARQRRLALPAATGFRALPGQGAEATIDGRLVQVGSRRLVPADDPALAGLTALESQGLTAVAVLVQGQVLGLLGLADRVRPQAFSAVRRLAALTQAPVQLLTGDQAASAQLAATAVGIEPKHVHAGLLPTSKGDAVARLRGPGGLMFVGDGVNDAPALAAADLGVAMGRGGSDIAIDNADVVLVEDDLDAVASLVQLSRDAMRLVRQNLILAAAAIAVLVVLDLAGHLPLPLGVAGHEGSTVLIGLNALRLLRPHAWNRPAPEPDPATATAPDRAGALVAGGPRR